MQHGGCWQCIQQVLPRNVIGQDTGSIYASTRRPGINVSLGEKLIYVQTNRVVAHDGIDCELALDLMAEQQDAAAVEGNDKAKHYAAA
jgi:hypothetical protein